MPSQRPKYDWPIRLQLTSSKKPHLADLPGLDTVGLMVFRYPSGRKGWKFCLDCLFAN